MIVEMKNPNNKKILLEMLNRYALTTGDASFYSGYTKDYFYQMKIGTRRVTEPVLTSLCIGLKRVYNQISNLNINISQSEFNKKLKEYHVFTRHLHKMLNIPPNTIASYLYRIRNNALRDSIFREILSKIILESSKLSIRIEIK